MAAILFDDFPGSGALAMVAPAIPLAPGLSWSGDSAVTLSGGYAVVPSPANSMSLALATIGDGYSYYGHTGPVGITFVMRTPPVITLTDGYSHGGVEILTKHGGLQSSFKVWGYYDGSSLAWYVNNNGASYINIQSEIAADTEYTGEIVISDGMQSFEFLGHTLYTSNPIPDVDAGLNEVTFIVRGSSKLGSLSAASSVTTETIVISVAGPMASVAAFTGYSGDVTAPMSTASGQFFDSIDAAIAGPMPSAKGYFGGAAYIAPIMATLYATAHDGTGENAASITAPKGLLLAYGGSAGRARAPMAQLSIAATGVNWLNAELTAPAGTLSASGTVSGTAQGELTTPMATLVGYGGMACSVTLGGRPMLQASVTAGGIMRAAIAAPSARLTMFEVTTEAFSRAEIIAPAGKMGGTLQAWVIAPAGRLSAVGTATVTATYEAYNINLTHAPGNPAPVDEVTRYTNFPFTHIVRYQGSYFGVAADGLYLLEGTTDDGVAIPYALKTGTDDFDTPQLKTVAAAYFGGRLGPSATVTLHAGETGAESYSYTTPRGQAAQSHREKFGRGVKSRYFALGLAGEDALALDSIELEINKMKRRV